eukprot:scaffold175913_cov34-Tisochrysis_lutea.AAC.5
MGDSSGWQGMEAACAPRREFVVNEGDDEPLQPPAEQCDGDWACLLCDELVCVDERCATQCG